MGSVVHRGMEFFIAIDLMNLKTLLAMPIPIVVNLNSFMVALLV